MFDSPLNILYMVLAVVVLLCGILFAIALIYFIFILRDVSKATFLARDTMEKVNDFIYKPLSVLNSVMEKVGPLVEKMQERGEEIMEEKMKKARKKRGRPKKN